ALDLPRHRARGRDPRERDGRGDRQSPPSKRHGYALLATVDAALVAPKGGVVGPGAQNLRMFGRIRSRSACGTPNHSASCAKYWSTDVVGTRRPAAVSRGLPE